MFYLRRKERERDFAFGFVFMESKLKGRKENATKTHQLWGLVGGVLFGWFLGNKLYDYSQGLFPLVISFINSSHRQPYGTVSSLRLSYLNFSLIRPATSNFVVNTFAQRQPYTYSQHTCSLFWSYVILCQRSIV